jgi:hypothetical protein
VDPALEAQIEIVEAELRRLGAIPAPGSLQEELDALAYLIENPGHFIVADEDESR